MLATELLHLFSATKDCQEGAEWKDDSNSE